MKYIPGPEMAVFYDSSYSTICYGSFSLGSGTEEREVKFFPESRRLVVWGGGTVEGDIVDQNGAVSDRVILEDRKEKPRKEQREHGLVRLNTNPYNGQGLNNPGVWEECSFLPGVRVMWLPNGEFDKNKIDGYFDSERFI